MAEILAKVQGEEEKKVVYHVTSKVKFTYRGLTVGHCTGQAQIRFNGIVIAKLSSSAPEYIADVQGEYEIAVCGECVKAHVYVDNIIGEAGVFSHDFFYESCAVDIFGHVHNVRVFEVRDSYLNLIQRRVELPNGSALPHYSHLVDCECC